MTRHTSRNFGLEKRLKTIHRASSLISKGVSNHNELTNIGKNTHDQIDTHLSSFQQGSSILNIGDTYVDVPHTLGQIPSSYAITSDIYDGAIWYIDNETAANFRINIFAPQFNVITYKWRIWK